MSISRRTKTPKEKNSPRKVIDRSMNWVI